MTTERLLFIQWLAASERMNKASGSEHEYWIGKVTAYCEIFAEINNTTFIEANRALMNMQAEIVA